MSHRSRWLGMVLVLSGWALVNWTVTPAGAASQGDAAKVEPAAGGHAARVKVSAKAAERLGIQTTPVREQESGGKGDGRRKVIPYSAVLYGLDGKTWAYTSPEALVFVRQRIEVHHIRGDVAVLSDGPPIGTAVVSVGGAELLGIELGVGK